MTYGLSFRDVSRVNDPTPIGTPWGTYSECTARPEYALTRVTLRKGAAWPLRYHLVTRGAYYVEVGDVVFRQRDREGAPSAERARKGAVVTVDAGALHALHGLEDSIVYLFSNRAEGDRPLYAETAEEAAQHHALVAGARDAAGKTSDFRDKYWGTIESVVSEEFAGKRIFLRKGGQSSLEFHVHKVETYFIHSGKVKVGLRTGRAENRSVVLSEGQSFDVTPGVMHMRMALEDTCIIEISTADSDTDSHLVEDGMKYKHVEVEE